jgi:hypothetical protein
VEQKVIEGLDLFAEQAHGASFRKGGIDYKNSARGARVPESVPHQSLASGDVLPGSSVCHA